MDFYKINKTEKTFKIALNTDSSIVLQLSCKEISNVFQHRHAIIAEKTVENTIQYELYLPSTSNFCPNITTSHPMLIFSNIVEYLCYNGFFAFRLSTENNWKILSLENFELELSSKDYLQKRLSQLPSIPYKEGDVAYFREEFETLFNIPNFSDYHFLIFHVGKEDFLIVANMHEIGLYNSGIKVSPLGCATMLSGSNGHYFKSSKEGKEYWNMPLKQDGPYGKIEEFEEGDYPSAYPKEDFTGYWKKAFCGFILGLTFLSNSSEKAFSLSLPFPAKKLRFLKQFSKINSFGGKSKEPDAWEVIKADGQRLLMFFSPLNESYFLVDPKDLLE